MSYKKFYLLQVNDSLFPIGGYSHSQGLETYIQKGLVYDLKTAEKYIVNKINMSFKYTDLLSVRLSYEKAVAGDVAGLVELEDMLTASRLPQEQREAVRKMGSRFAKTVEGLNLAECQQGVFKEFIDTRTSDGVSHPCVYGVFCAALGIELEEVLAHFLYSQTSAMVTNCVKTIPLSQTAGQQMLSDCYGELESVLEEVMALSEADLCLSAPGFDVRGIQHEVLYSRLYMS